MSSPLRIKVALAIQEVTATIPTPEVVSTLLPTHGTCAHQRRTRGRTAWVTAEATAYLWPLVVVYWEVLCLVVQWAAFSEVSLQAPALVNVLGEPV